MQIDIKVTREDGKTHAMALSRNSGEPLQVQVEGPAVFSVEIDGVEKMGKQRVNGKR